MYSNAMKSMSRPVSTLFLAALYAAGLSFPGLASGQIAGAVERAAQRAARSAAERAAAKGAFQQGAQPAARGSAGSAGDKAVNSWTSALCKPAAKCPLPPETANTFVGGAYREVVLGRETVLYRTFTNPQFKFGDPVAKYSYWSRSDARGTQAVIDSAIPVSRNGNTAQQLVAIRVPKGSTVYEGKAQSINHGPAGGGGQVVIKDVKSSWEVHAAATAK